MFVDTKIIAVEEGLEIQREVEGKWDVLKERKRYFKIYYKVAQRTKHAYPFQFRPQMIKQIICWRHLKLTTTTKKTEISSL